LERRLRSRGQDADDEIARRLSKAKAEIAASERLYDFFVVNDDVERAGREAQAIVVAARCSRARSRGRLSQVLASFGG
jgi:guanylate kinase